MYFSSRLQKFYMELMKCAAFYAGNFRLFEFISYSAIPMQPHIFLYSITRRTLPIAIVLSGRNIIESIFVQIVKIQ